jgi:hypothetical protein
LNLRVALAVGLAGLVGASAAFAASPATTVPLPSPAQTLRRSPPLTTNAPLFELRILGRIGSRQRVDVGLDPKGKPVSVTATQRLTLNATGDYSFPVPAPVIDVVAAPGSDSEPGLRTDVIIWQGFSPGRRVLGARAKLRVRDSAPSLPLRVSLEARVNGIDLAPDEARTGRLDLALTLHNTTVSRFATFEADAFVGELAAVLDQLRRTVDRGGPYLQKLVRVKGTSGAALPGRMARVEAPLEIHGLIRFPRGALRDVTVVNGRRVPAGVAFTARLGDRRPLQLTDNVRGQARALRLPTLSVTARPVSDISTLRPPRGDTWREAIARGLVRVRGRPMLRTTIDTILRLALVRQYNTFLLNPDGFPRAAADQTVYNYRTAPSPPAVVSTPPEGSDDGVLVPILLSVGGVLAAGAFLVVWAHS